MASTSEYPTLFGVATLFIFSPFSIAVYLILQSRIVKIEHVKEIHLILALDPLTKNRSADERHSGNWKSPKHLT